MFRDREQHVVLGIAGATLAITTLAPVLALVPDLLGSLGSVLGTLPATRVAVLLLRSLGLAASVTMASLVIGVPLGVCIGRTNVLGRRAAWAVHAFPMFLPPFLLALGWFHVLGRGGILGSETSAQLLFGEPGAVGVLAFALSPVVTSLTALALQGVDPSLEEAGRMIAGPWRVAARILLPLCRPTIGLSCLIVFSLAFSELGVPMFLRIEAYPAAVFSRLGGVAYAPGEAAALSLPLVAVALLLFGLERSISRARTFATLGIRHHERTTLALGRWRAPVSIACWIVCLLGILPLMVLLLRGMGSFSVAWEWLGSTPSNSLVAAFCAATIITLVGITVGHGMARDTTVARILDGVAALGFVVPSSVLGIGLITVWNRAALHVVYGTIAIIVIGFVARYGVIGIRACAAAFAQSPPEMEDAATVFGAGYFRRIFRVLLPLHVRGLVGAWLLAFVFCLRDLETAVLFYPPGAEPLTVRIFTLEANGKEGVVAALTITQVAMTALALAVGGLLLRRRGLS